MAAIQKALSERDLPAANRQLSDYLRDHDADADAHLLAAKTARRLDDFPTANKHLDRFRELDGNPDEVELELMLRRSQSGDLTGAGGALKLCTEQPDNASVPLMIEALARGYLAAGRPDVAVTVTDVWLKHTLGPGDRAYALFLRGRGHELQAKIPDALANYREALDLNPKLSECALALADVLGSEFPLEALPLYDRLREEGYKPTQVTVGTARCLRQLGELDRAATLLAPVLAGRPESVPALVEAAKIELDRRRPAEAEVRLKSALALAPKYRDANVQYARCLHQLGRDAEAAEQLAKVQRLDDELFRPEKSP